MHERVYASVPLCGTLEKNPHFVTPAREIDILGSAMEKFKINKPQVTCNNSPAEPEPGGPLVQHLGTNQMFPGSLKAGHTGRKPLLPQHTVSQHAGVI